MVETSDLHSGGNNSAVPERMDQFYLKKQIEKETVKKAEKEVIKNRTKKSYIMKAK